MGWDLKKKLEEAAKKAVDLGKDAANKVGDVIDGEPEQSTNVSFDEIVTILNNPQQGAMMEQKFNMDISGAKKDDGVVSKGEAVELLSDFAGRLIDQGYIKSDVSDAVKKQSEAQLRQDLGSDVKAYDALDADEKDNLLHFISIPKDERDQAIMGAAQNGLAVIEHDGGDAHYVMVDQQTGTTYDFNAPKHPAEGTHAYTEQPEVPAYIAKDLDIG